MVRRLSLSHRVGRAIVSGFPLVWLMLGIARLLVLVVPFRRLAPLLGNSLPLLPVSIPVSQGQAQVARHWAGVIRSASRWTPWLSNCFAQALVACWLMRWYRVPCLLCFGLRRQDGELQAHAWVMAGPVAVSGGNGFTEYALVGCFMSARTPIGPMP